MSNQAESRYEANLALLGQKMPQMVEQIRQFPLTNVQLMPTPTGKMYGHAWSVELQQWVPLCNGSDPEAEAEADCTAMYNRDIKVYCLLGMGLGYFTTALARRLRPHQRLVVFDLDPNLYKASLYATDFTPILTEGKRIDFVIGNDALQQVEQWWLSLGSMEKMHIAGPMRAGYTEHCFKAQYDTLLTKTIDMMRLHAVGLSTWKTFGSAIGDNDLLNMPEYFLNPGYEHLKDLWKDKPAVCVAAGPSLHKNLRLLLNPTYRDKVLVIAVGTVYAMLKSMGIHPDIVTTIDFQRLNWGDQFQDVPLDDAPPLVYLHSTYPQTVRRWPGPKFVAENASDTVSWFRQFAGGKKGAGQVQTVAHLNLLVAAELGANPIILLGQDLSMPPDTHHAAGARAQDLAPNEAPIDAFVVEKDCYGEQVQTRHSFLSMKTVFERIAQENPASVFLNCTEGGLPLQGLQNLPLEPVLKGLPSPENGTQALQIFHRAVTQEALSYPGYIPDVLREGLAGLMADVDVLKATAHEIDLSVKLQDDPLTNPEIRQHILAQEAEIQSRQPAFGLFAIRNFGFLELLSEVPPLCAEEGDALAKDTYNCERLVRIAALIREELPAVQRLLRITNRRIEAIREAKEGSVKNLEDVCRLIAQQLYLPALDALWHVARKDDPVANLAILDQLRGRIAYQRQEYLVALSYGIPAPIQDRIRARQFQYRRETSGALATYFPQDPFLDPVTDSVTASVAVPDPVPV